SDSERDESRRCRLPDFTAELVKECLKLQPFDGKIWHWNTFWQEFHENVAKFDEIPNAVKLKILKANIGEPACRMIEALADIDENYAIAIEMLRCKYDREEEIADALIAEIRANRPRSDKM